MPKGQKHCKKQARANYENCMSVAVYNKDHTTTGKLHNYRNKT